MPGESSFLGIAKPPQLKTHFFGLAGREARQKTREKNNGRMAQIKAIYNGKPLLKWMIWGETPTIFGNIHIPLLFPIMEVESETLEYISFFPPNGAIFIHFQVMA